MRLLNIHDLRVQEYFESSVPPYIILSHRWSDEVSFKEFRKGLKKESLGYRKIQAFCDFVKLLNSSHPDDDDIHWVWIDTCMQKHNLVFL